MPYALSLPRLTIQDNVVPIVPNSLYYTEDGEGKVRVNFKIYPSTDSIHTLINLYHTNTDNLTFKVSEEGFFLSAINAKFKFPRVHNLAVDGVSEIEIEGEIAVYEAIPSYDPKYPRNSEVK